HRFLAQDLFDGSTYWRRQMPRKDLPRPVSDTPLINETVVGDAEQPSLEIAPCTELVQTGKGLKKSVLRQVLGCLAMMRQMKQPAVKTIPVAFGQCSKCLAVTLLRSVDEKVLFIWEHFEVIEWCQAFPPNAK